MTVDKSAGRPTTTALCLAELEVICGMLHLPDHCGTQCDCNISVFQSISSSAAVDDIIVFQGAFLC